MDRAPYTDRASYMGRALYTPSCGPEFLLCSFIIVLIVLIFVVFPVGSAVTNCGRQSPVALPSSLSPVTLVSLYLFIFAIFHLSALSEFLL